MKFKTFILTFLMMMSCSISFGQNGVEITVNSRGELEDALNGDHGWYPQIKLGQSFGVSKRVDVKAGVTATLDLNGYTLSADNKTYVLNNLGNLTIKDSSTEGTGTIEGRGIYNGSHGSVDDTDLAAVLTIESGIFKNTGTNGGAAIYNLGTAYINGGTFYGEYAAIHNRLAVMHIKNVYIIGKTINSYGDFRNSGALYIGENVYFYGKYSEEKNGSHSGEFTYLVAKIGNAYYATLQDAINNATKTGETVTLIADCAGDVTVTQAPDYAITIDGDDNTFKGTITVDGKSARYETTALTIKNVNFDATEGITYDACINLGVSGNSNTRYTNNVTVENCTFTDNDYSSVAVKSYTGGDYNLVVKDCEANGMHSLAQLKNIEQGLVISGNIANTKNGINLNQTAVGTIEGNEINVKGYAVRIGESTGGNITLNENTLKTDNTEGDPVIELRGTVVALNMEKNVVSGNTHIKGTAGTISVDANYWDGKEAPVVAEGSAPIVVNSYYADEDLENLVRNEIGSIYAFVLSDRIFGEVTTNAIESIKIEIIGKDNNVIGSSTLEKTEHATGFNNTLTWRINLGADDSGSWAMAWNEGAPSINNMPAKVKLYVDDAAVAEAEIKYTANGDGTSPVFAAKTNAEGRINSFIACTGEYNLNNANTFLKEALTAGDNVAITVAGTYAVPTGKNLTITGAVENVKFDMSKAVGINSSMTFNNVTFEYGNANYVGLQHAGTMVYNNCIINGQVFLYGTSETFNNCTFNQNSADAYNVWTYGAAQVAFNECTFNSAGKSVLIYAEGANIFNDVIVTDCDFIASSPVEGKAAIEMDSSLTAGINLTIDGETTADGFGSGNVSGNSLWNNKKGNNNDANNDITVVVAGETVLEPVYVAKIGEEGHRTLQEAIDAATAGDNTINLLDDVKENVTVIQKEGFNILIDGNKAENVNYQFDGIINIYGNARHTGTETLTIQNIDFYTEVSNTNAYYFINALENGSVTVGNTTYNKQYAHNVTVKGCNFTTSEEDTDNQIVGIGLRQTYNIVVDNCTAKHIFSLMWGTAVDGLKLNQVTLEYATEGITLAGASKGVEIKNSKIVSPSYGIRAEGTGSAFTIENSTLEAKVPVVVRKVNKDSKPSFTFKGTNTITESNPTSYWFVAGAGDAYQGNENEPLPETAGQVSVTLNDTNLNREGIYGSALNGEGTEEKPYLIETVNDLVFFRDRVNGGNNYAGKHVKLAADIDLSSIENWTPIGDITYNNKYQPADSTKVFSGEFNGNDKVISNLKIEKIIDDDTDGPDADANVGLFGITGKGAVIKNLTLTNVDILTDGRNVGALAGFAYMATLDSITVNGDIKIEGGNNVSGVAGMTRYYAMSATNIKVIGNDGSTIVGNNIVGGIFAEIAPNGSAQTFKNLSVENVAINGVGGVGGIVGLLTLGTVEDVTVKNVALTGNTLYQGNPMGRIRLGSVSGLMGSTYATIANVTTENVTAKNLEGTEIEDLPIIGANYGAATNATEARIGDTYYSTLKKAIEAVKEGDNTIQLLADITGNVTVTQKEGVNIVIDGKKAENKNYQFNGTIYIEGNSRYTGEETLTIQNVNFYTENPSHDFISANSTDSDKRYAHNVTVNGCNFATSETNVNNTVVGLRLRQAYDIAVENCTSDNIFSLMWSTGVDGLALNNVTVEKCTEGISIGGKSQKVTITGYNITSPSFGIRASIEGGQFTMTNSTIDALVPVVVRNENNITDLAQYTLSFTFEGTNTIKENNPTNYWFVAGETEYKGADEVMPTAPKGNIIVNLNDNGLSYNGVYGNFAVAKIGDVQYLTFEAALNAVQNNDTITVLNVEGSELKKEIEFTKDIEFTIKGTAPKYALPVVTFQNATVNISNAKILIPELDAREDATINVINSTVYDAGGDGIVKSYYNGAINIDANSTVYTMQVTTMGYITVDGTLNATWQTNVYGNGLITLNEGATFNTAGLNLIAKEYSGRDNTDEERVGKPAEIVVDGANFTVGKVYSASGADYSYNADGYGINVGTIEGKSAILTIKNGGNVNIYTGNGKTANIGADGTVNIDASTFNVVCRAENGTATLANNGTMNVTGEASINIKNLTGKAINFTDVTIADAYIGGRVNAFGTNNFSGETNVTGILSLGYETDPSEQVVVNITGNFNGSNVIVSTNNGVDNILNVGSAEGARTIAYFGQLGAFADVNIVNSDVTYHYAFVRNDFNVTNSTMEITGGVNTYFSGNAKVVLDKTTWNLPGFANIGSYGGYNYGNADVTLKNGSSMTATNLGVEQYDGKTVILTLEDSSTLTATNLSNTGSIVLANDQAKVTSNVFDNAPTTTVAYHKVNYVEGSYVVVAKDYVAQIYDVNNNTNDDRRYETLQEALNAAQDGETIKLIADEIFTEDNRTNSSGTWYEGVYYVGNKNFTIDLNNYEVTQNGAVNDYMFLFKNDGEKDNTITLKNGTIDAGTAAFCALATSSSNVNKITINTENINFVGNNSNGAVLKIRGGTELNVKAGTVITGNDNYVGIEAYGNGTVVNINEGAEIYQNGKSSYVGSLVGASGNGTVNVYGGKGTSAQGGFIAMTSGGTINVSGGEWTANTNGATANDNNAVLIAQSDKQNYAGAGNSIVNVSGGVFKGGYNCYGNAEGDAQINISGGIFSVDPSIYCADNYGAFPYDENSWVVREIKGEQTIALQAGWNWMSSYISEFDTDGLTMLTTKLGENGVQIKNNLGSLTNGGDYYGWYGTLNAVSVKEMYKVNVVEAQEFKYEGNYVNYDECVIPLYKGWNYIGYPVNERMSLADALAELDANVGDVIKAQNGTAVYTEEEGWFSFDLTELVPGEGYMYQNTSNSIKQLTYTTKKTTSTDSDNRSSKYWTVDATQYPSNMTMIAMTDVEGGDYEVAAFVNGELRGSSRPVYVESLNAHILVLTISGDEVAEVTFKYYDIATGEEVAFSNRINYSNDAVVGSMAEPYMLTRGTTGIGEASLSEINIYPNPTTTGTEINLQATCDKVEVFNALGVKVAEYQNVDTIDALETAGIYVIRITNNGEARNCRLVVK